MTSYLGANDLYNLDSRFQPVVTTNFVFLNQDSLPAIPKIIKENDSLVVYPARPMLYSLILPGIGQYQPHREVKMDRMGKCFGKMMTTVQRHPKRFGT